MTFKGDSPEAAKEDIELTVTGLHTDAYNEWANIATIAESCQHNISPVDEVESIPPIKHYVERFSNSSDTDGEAIIRVSNPERVAAFDALVDEFNEDLARMKRERDYTKMQALVQKAWELIFVDRS